MVKIIKESLAFDDVLIQPQFSEIRSRSEIDLSVSLTKDLKFKIPVFPSNMKTVINRQVIEEICKLEGLSLMHRFLSLDEQINILKTFNGYYNFVGASIGVKKEDYDNVERLVNLGIKIICI